jgi:hypothetical protein
MADEDKRQAAGLAIGVSNQLMTAALTMLPILGAIVVFVLDKRSVTWSGGITVAFSFLAFLFSIGLGALGVSAIYTEGHGGNWDYMKGDSKFQLQVFTAFLGLILFVVSMFLMGPSQTETDLRVVKNTLDSLKNETRILNNYVLHLNQKVDSFKTLKPKVIYINRGFRRSHSRCLLSPQPSP